MSTPLDLITPHRVARLHEEARQFGPCGDDGVPKPGCVEGAIGNAEQAAGYAAEYGQTDALLVAAFLLRSLTMNHCYTDGNKRVAWLSCLEVLSVGLDCTVKEDEMVAAAFVEGITTGTVSDVSEIASWLGRRLVALYIESDNAEE